MAYVIELTNEQWKLVADLFDPPGRRGAPARDQRRRRQARSYERSEASAKAGVEVASMGHLLGRA